MQERVDHAGVVAAVGVGGEGVAQWMRRRQALDEGAQARRVRAFGGGEVGLDLGSGKGGGVEGGFVEFAFEGEETVAATAEEDFGGVVGEGPGDFGFDLFLAVEIHGEFFVFADKHDVVPVAIGEAGFAGDDLSDVVAGVEEEVTCGDVGVGAADAEVLTERAFVAVEAAREEVGGDGASIGGEAVPEPEFGGVSAGEFWERGAEAAAGEVGGAVDVAGGEGIGFFGFGGEGAAGALDTGEAEGDAVFPGGGGLIGGLARLRAGEVVEGPVGEGFVLEDGAAIGRVAIGEGASGLGADFFEEGEGGFDDLGFGGFFEAGGAGGPGGVAAEAVLFGRWDVAFGAVGEFDVEGGGEGALEFEFQAGDAVDFVRQGGDGEVAEAEGLEDEFGLGVGVDPFGLLGVDFFLGFGHGAVAGGVDGCGPG